MMKLAIDTAVEKGSNFQISSFFLRAVKKALRQGNSMKGDFIETPYVFVTSAEAHTSTYRAP